MLTWLFLHAITSHFRMLTSANVWKTEVKFWYLLIAKRKEIPSMRPDKCD